MEKDRKYRRIGWLTSALTQIVLLVLFYFLIAWKEPFPPIPSFGIELSFGLEEQGSGDEPLSAPETQEVAQEETQETEELPEEEAEEQTSTEEIVDEPVEAAPVEAPATETPSPDVVKPKEEVKPVPKEVKETEQPKEQKTNPQAEMPASNTPNESRGETAKEGAQGKEDGSLDGRALMGEEGAGEGASLQMAGWKWDASPKPKDDSSESGKIVYRIKIDSEGYLIGIELVSSTVSPVVERQYRQSIERLTFSKTSSESSAPISSGTVTFIIRSR